MQFKRPCFKHPSIEPDLFLNMHSEPPWTVCPSLHSCSAHSHVLGWGRSQDSAGAVPPALQAPGLNYFSPRTAFLRLLEYELRPVATSLMFPLTRFHHLIYVGQIAFGHFFLSQVLVPLIQVIQAHAERLPDGTGTRRCSARPSTWTPKELMTWKRRHESHIRLGAGRGISWPSCIQPGLCGDGVSTFCTSYLCGLRVLCLLWPNQGKVAQTVPVWIPLVFYAFVFVVAQIFPVEV